jgi:signal peptidase II
MSNSLNSAPDSNPSLVGVQTENTTAVEAAPQADTGALRWLGLSLLVVLLDQASKFVVISKLDYLDEVPVNSFLSWVRWHNEGAAFSMLADAGAWKHYFFVGLALFFVIFIVWELRRLPVQQKLMGFVYGLILGGALGNLIDRFVHGHVVDFILVHYQSSYFPAFNLADSALFLGATLWLWLLWQEYRADRAQANRKNV